MSDQSRDVNEIVSLSPSTANLVNVSIAMEAVESVMNRSNHLPGAVTFTGFSGFGKSMAVDYVAQHYRGFYVEFQDNWGKQDYIKMLMFIMNIKRLKGWGENDCVQAIIDELGTCGRPLIIDEFDQLIDRKHVASSLMALTLNIIKKSGGSVIIVGEELLPQKLRTYEKFDNCIYGRYLAEPSKLNDCRILARHYYPELQMDDELLEATEKRCKGITRRICINLDRFAAEARDLGLTSIGLAQAGKLITTGEAAKARTLK